MAKVVFTCRLEEGLLERVRNILWHRPTIRKTITDLIEEHLESWASTEEAAHNKGKAFPQREGELPYSKKRGRKPKED